MPIYNPYRSYYNTAKKVWNVRNNLYRGTRRLVGQRAADLAYNPYRYVYNTFTGGYNNNRRPGNPTRKINRRPGRFRKTRGFGGYASGLKYGSSKSVLKRFNVQDLISQYTIRNASHQMVIPANKQRFSVLSSADGLFAKNMYDQIYTTEGFTDSDRDVVITHQKMVHRLKNQTDMPIEISLYYTKLKRDFNSNFGTLLGSTISDGFANIGAANSQDQEMGVSYYMNEKFKFFFKILSVKKLTLQPGQIRNITQTSAKIFKRNFQYKEETSINALKGQHMIFYAANGVPVHDSTTSTNIGLSNGIVDVFQTCKYTYRVPNASELHAADIQTGFTAPAAPVGFVEEDWAEDAVET